VKSVVYSCPIGPKHKQSARCIKWTNIKQEQTSKEINKTLTKKTVFIISGIPIRIVDEFKYLGRMLEKMTVIGRQ
jgi:hypothetical protein